MFGGVPTDQLHQFIIASTTTTTSTNSLPLLSPSLHGFSSSPPSTFCSFDLRNHHAQVPLPPDFLHPSSKNEDKHHSFVIQRDRSIPESVDPWSNDEVLALFRIRSSLENWSPQFTWDHVSGKLAEFGFKRSAEKCKEKFEEESRYFNNINFSKNCRVFGEFEDLYNGDNNNNNNQNSQEIVAEKNKKLDKPSQEEDSRMDQKVLVEKEVEQSKTRKRKRDKKFEIFKGFCEDIIRKIMAQQEEMNNKLLEDMAKRDEEKVAREEAWKNQAMDRINKELELRAQEQAIAGDRQATIINFLKKFSSPSNVSSIEDQSSKLPTSPSSLMLPQNPNSESSTSTTIVALPDRQDSNFLAPKNNPIASTQNPNSSSTSIVSLAPQNPNNNLNSQSSLPTEETVQEKHMTSNHKDDIGKRWPKEEVLALINLRCSLCNSNEDKESATVKAPLWERISKGMLDLGYKRSAKRCKEKWENINKYFRKTKDVNKKRSVDSGTCPYFHQLSTLYNQGKLVASSDRHENRSVSPETRLEND